MFLTELIGKVTLLDLAFTGRKALRCLGMALLVLLASASFGGPGEPGRGIGSLHPAYLDHLHAQAWRDGGVCRHAAAVVWMECRKSGIPCVVQRFRTTEKMTNHVIPMVYMDYQYYLFESTSIGNPRHISRFSPDFSIDEYSNISGHRSLTEQVNSVSDMMLTRWNRDMAWIRHQKVHRKGCDCAELFGYRERNQAKLNELYYRYSLRRSRTKQ